MKHDEDEWGLVIDKLANIRGEIFEFYEDDTNQQGAMMGSPYEVACCALETIKKLKDKAWRYDELCK